MVVSLLSAFFRFALSGSFLSLHFKIEFCFSHIVFIPSFIYLGSLNVWILISFSWSYYPKFSGALILCLLLCLLHLFFFSLHVLWILIDSKVFIFGGEWCEEWDSSVPPELFCICFFDFPLLNTFTACDQLSFEWLVLKIPAFLDNVRLASKRGHGRLGVSLSCRFWRASKISTVFLRVVVWFFCDLF